VIPPPPPRRSGNDEPPDPGPIVLNPETGEPLEDRLADRVRYELLRSDASGIARSIVAERDWTPVPPLVTLRQAIDEAPELEPPRIERVCPANARVTIIAPKKTGKSTLVLNLVRSVTTGDKFLDRWPTRQGRVAVLNYEVLAEQWAHWCAEAGIPLDESLVLSLRGLPNPLASARGRKELAAQLRDHSVDVLVVDPFGRASNGIVDEENSNSQVRRFTAMLDELAHDAGVSELVLPVHAGKAGEEARGASELGDWPDALWTLVRDDNGNRFFAADGRDVDMPEEMLQWNHQNRRLSFTAVAVNRATAKLHAATDLIIDIIGAEPGINISGIEAALQAAGIDVTKKGQTGRWLRELDAQGVIRQSTGERNAKIHHLPDDLQDLAA
jgi:hypothetical protein